VFKGFYEELAHYFNSKYLKGGYGDGSYPLPVELPFKSIYQKPLEITKLLEESLTSLDFEEAKGDYSINLRNVNKFNAALLPILGEKRQIGTISNGMVCCSDSCNGIKVRYNYKMIDESRFALGNCFHFSQHIQCIIT